MSGVPMEADTGHAFSGGALSERGERLNGDGVEPSRPTTPRSESVTHYEAAPALGGTGMWRVLELPATVEVAVFPTLEAAQAYALALNEWLARRPDPVSVQPFYAPDEVALLGPGWPELEGIFERMLRPETP